MAYYYFSIGKYETSIELYKEIIANNIYSKEIYYCIAFSLFQRGRYRESFQYCQIGLLEYKADFKLKEIVFLIQFSFSKVEGLLLQISDLKKEGYNSEILCNLEGQIYVDIQGNYTTAIALYNKSLKQYPNSGMLQYYLGSIFYKQGKYKQAELMFSQSLEHNFIYSYYGILRCIKKDSTRSLNRVFFQSFFDQKEKFENDLTLVGNIFYELGKYKESLSYYKQSLKNIPNDYCAFNGIANCLLSLKKNKQAFIFFKKTLKIRKYDHYALNGIGNIYFQEKKYTDALKYYSKSYSSHSQNAYLLYKIGLSYYFLGDCSTSYTFLQKSYRLNPSNHMCQRYLKKLGKAPNP